MSEERRFCVEGQGFVDAFGEGPRGIFDEFDAVGVVGVFLDVYNGVVEATSDADDGDGAVAEAIHLVEAAGFESGRHKEEIGAGFDAVREAFVEAYSDGELGWELEGEIFEGGLV